LNVAILLIMAMAGAQELPDSPPAAETQADELRRYRDGYMVHRESGAVFRFRVFQDSLVAVRRGVGPEHPELVIPWPIFRSLTEEFHAVSRRDSVAVRRLEVGYGERFLNLNLSRPVSSVVASLLFAGLLFGGVNLRSRYRKHLRQARERERSVSDSRRYLAEGREDERRRLARELHDGPVQDLHGIRMRLHGKPAPGSLEAAGDDLLGVIRELRHVMENLRPPALGPFGLSAALRSYIDRVRIQNPDVAIDVSLEDDGQRLPESVRISLFRITQEAITNAMRHAGATRLKVLFAIEQDNFRLEIEDDGCGFELPNRISTLGDRGHYGLLGIMERVEALDAESKIDSRPGKGTVIRIRGKGDMKSREENA
jgi:signal transduction histidine kinase